MKSRYEKAPKGLRRLRRLFIPLQALLLIFSIVLCFYANQRISSNYQAELHQRVNRLVNELNAYPEQFAQIQNILLFDGKIRTAHGNQGYSELSELQSKLRLYTLACPGLSAIWYHYSEDTFWYSGTDSSDSLRYARRFSLGSSTEELEEFFQGLGPFHVIRSVDEYSGVPCFFFIYQLKSAVSSAEHTTVFQLEERSLERLLREALSEDFLSASLLNTDGDVLLSVGESPARRTEFLSRELLLPGITLRVCARAVMMNDLAVRLLLALALLLLNLLLALSTQLVSSRYYMPMKALRRRAADVMKQDDNDDLDDYEYVKSSLEIICLQHRRLANDFQTQKDAAEDYILYSVLSGRIADMEEFKQKVALLNVRIPYDHLRVVVLLPEDEQARTNLARVYKRLRAETREYVVACALREDVPCGVAVVSYSPAMEETFNRQLKSCLSVEEGRFSLGVSAASQDLKTMPLQYAQAFYACALRQGAPTYYDYASPEQAVPTAKQLQDALIAWGTSDFPVSHEATLSLLQGFLLYFSTAGRTLPALIAPEIFCKADEAPDMVKNELIRLLNASCEMETFESADRLEPIDEMKRYIQEQFDHPMFSLQTMGEHFSMSTSALSSYFKKQSGLLLTDFVTTLRIDKAKRLLRESDLSVQAISAAVGYCSCTSFIRRFRLMTGKTPGEYRLSPEEK